MVVTPDGGKLSIDIEGDSGGLQSAVAAAKKGLDSLQESMQSAGRASRRAARGVDEVSDQLRSIPPAAAAAAGSMTAYSLSTRQARSANRLFRAAMYGSLIPALIALTTTLNPVISLLGALTAGLLGVAGGFGAVVGSGILAYGDDLSESYQEQLKTVNDQISQLEALRDETGGLTDAQQKQLKQLENQRDELQDTDSVTGALTKRLKELKSEIFAIVEPLGDQFVPLIRDAVNALPTLVQRIVDALGPLDAFTAALRDLGQFAMRAIPQMTEWFMDLGRETLPIFRDLAEWFVDRIPDMLEVMRNSVEATYDVWHEFLVAVVDVLGPMTRAGNVVTNIVVPALTDMVEALRDVFVWFNDLEPALQRMVTVASILAPAVLFLSGKVFLVAAAFAVLLPLLSSLAPIFVGLGAVIYAWQKDIGGAREAVEILTRTLSEEFMATLAEVERAVGAVADSIIDSFNLAEKAGSTSMGELVGRITTFFKEGMMTIGQTIRSGLRTFTAWWQEHGLAVVNTVRTLYGIVVDQLTMYYNILKTVVQTVLGAVISFWEEHGDTILSTLQDVRQALRQFRSRASSAINSVISYVQRLISTFGDIPSKIRNAVSLAITHVKRLPQQFSTSLARIRSLVDTYVAEVRKNFRVLVRSVKRVVRVGLKIIQNVWDEHIGLVQKRVRGHTRRLTNIIKRLFARLGTVYRESLKLIAGIVESEQGSIENIVSLALERLILVYSDSLRTIERIISSELRQWTQFFRKNGTKIKSIVRNFLGLLIDIEEQAQRGMLRLWKKHGKKVLRTIRNWVDLIMDTIRFLAQVLIDIVQPLLARLRVFWDEHGRDITNIVVGLIGILVALFRGLANLLKGILEPALGFLQWLWKNFGDEIVMVVKLAADIIISTIGWMIDTLVAIIELFQAAMEQDWKKFWSIIAGWLEDTLNGIIDFVRKWGPKLVDEFVQAIKAVIDWFKQLAKDLIGGSIIPDMLSDILKAVGNWNIVQKFKDVLGDAYQAVKDIASDITGAAQDALNDAKEYAQEAAEWAKDPLGKAGGAVDDFFSDDPDGGGGGGGGGNPEPRAGTGGRRFPRFHTGGVVERGGLALVSEGERVIAEKKREEMEESTEMTFNVYANSYEGGRAAMKGLDDELRSRNFNG